MRLTPEVFSKRRKDLDFGSAPGRRPDPELAPHRPHAMPHAAEAMAAQGLQTLGCHPHAIIDDDQPQEIIGNSTLTLITTALARACRVTFSSDSWRIRNSAMPSPFAAAAPVEAGPVRI